MNMSFHGPMQGNIVLIAEIAKCAAYKECLWVVIVLKKSGAAGIFVTESVLHCYTGSALLWTSTRSIELFVLLKNQCFHRNLWWVLRVIKILLREGSAFKSTWNSSKGLEFGFHPPLVVPTLIWLHFLGFQHPFLASLDTCTHIHKEKNKIF